jgi:hypothetical protein
MKILFTQHGLVRSGGTEFFVCEVASEFIRRGHQVAVYSGEGGPLAEKLARRGILILDDPVKCPWVPDTIHGQHRELALRAILSFPRTPALLHIHGFLPALEKPFRHPRILRYLTTADSLSDHWSKAFHIPRESFITIPNHVDLERFRAGRRPPERPLKALLYSNVKFSEEQLGHLRSACSNRGMTLELAGRCNPSSGDVERPEELLPLYDLVFGVGRSALEAAACGCGVIPVFLDMAEELLLPQTYDKLRGQNLSPRLSSHHRLCEQWIGSQMDRWDAPLIAEASNMVRGSANLEATVSLLEKIHSDLCRERLTGAERCWSEERDALEHFFANEGMRRLTRRHTDLMRKNMREKSSLEQRITSIEGSLSWKLTAPLRWVDGLWNGWNRKDTHPKDIDT